MSNFVEKESDFSNMVSARLSRRGFLMGAAAAGAGAFLALNPVAKAIAGSMDSSLLNFESIPTSTSDSIILPKGYSSSSLMSWGDPIFVNAPQFNPDGKQNSKAQALQFGDNTDGMSIFPLSKDRAILAVNNEYTNYEYLFAHQGKAMTADDVVKAQAAVGITIVEIVKENGHWIMDVNGGANRRITANTEMEVTGPAAGHDLLKTKADPTGKKVLGTFNNCANGETPWGTYLTCEENFNDFFGSETKAALTADDKRYGIEAEQSDYQWHNFDERFDISKNPNEPNRFGWVVEIDPNDPTSIPLKRTALGRFKHENAALVVNDDGHVVVYLGDDERGEHLYKFVSKNKYQEDNNAANRNLLEEGTLYVAKFAMKDDKLEGDGQWLELTYGKNGLTKENGFNSQAEVMIFARRAATQVGATTMDRPEWVAIHPDKKHVFCTLTNNKYRGVKEGQDVDGVNPRAENHYGQIVRWEPTNGDHVSDTFQWDLYLIAGNPMVHKGNLYAGSDNINKDNMFNSPDGIGFDKAGRLWIQTDGNYSNKGDFAGQGNNQMLCGDPKTGEVRRFLTGPIGCEITGLTFSEDQKTMFVGVQHPSGHFPQGGNHKPRSTIVMVTKDNGGVIGS
ncbi:PhoX family phosphatase [Aliivibrio sp. S4TY2]|uniref:PhoX family protein n=1 Tax=unclassified Aliivibrio TaxID=2645654 RepID=UPI002378D590|nr:MULTISPECIES: PhoX family phosphatase [unclassified Aliivibrio]MDD9155135.1 PhoX family phosphatase [Aliivibrio sp. S4TY2]MDD9159313.1 PhoX family phosphatase [Aliivibrio sp. S4TY1]MDD9163137.1 PhoX family phosphatase [Aliivibrio sp. S4MY2]MDD9167312.1 PhoX family phosphatase [Aliivibrio sp. S4MY4]MDD9184214.1 PhoX family phosphatase [Aliivibrio sp. S4MY3]